MRNAFYSLKSHIVVCKCYILHPFTPSLILFIDLGNIKGDAGETAGNRLDCVMQPQLFINQCLADRCRRVQHSRTHSIRIISRLVISSAGNKSIFGYHPRSVDSCNCNMIQNRNKSLCCVWMESNCSSKMIIWIIRSSLSRKPTLPSVSKEKSSTSSTLAQIKVISHMQYCYC